MLKIWIFLKAVFGLVLSSLILFLNLMGYLIYFQSSGLNSTPENTVLILLLIFSVASLVLLYKIVKTLFFNKQVAKFTNFLTVISATYIFIILSILIYLVFLV